MPSHSSTRGILRCICQALSPLSLSVCVMPFATKSTCVFLFISLGGLPGPKAIIHHRIYRLYTRKGCCLRGGGFGKQLVKGSPVYPSGQVHTGV